MRFEEMITIKTGKNLTRESEKNDKIVESYSFEDLTNDLDGLFLDSQEGKDCIVINDEDNYLCNVGDILYSYVSSKVGIVSTVNQGKIINQNFAKLIIDDTQIDKYYLCYMINESQLIKKQMAISMQGSIVLRSNSTILRELQLHLPIMEKQQIIGQSYFKWRKRKSLVKKQMEQEEKIFLEVLKKLDQ